MDVLMAMHMDAMQRWAETPEPFAKPQKTVCRDAHHAEIQHRWYGILLKLISHHYLAIPLSALAL